MSSKRVVNKASLANLDPVRGGHARAKAMTPDERSESARKASQTRWALWRERRATSQESAA